MQVYPNSSETGGPTKVASVLIRAIVIRTWLRLPLVEMVNPMQTVLCPKKNW
jgi:hypothetical protein